MNGRKGVVINYHTSWPPSVLRSERKDLFTRNIFYLVFILFIVIRITNRMGPSLIRSIIHTVIIRTLLNNNGGNNGQELNSVTCIRL